MLNYGKLCIFWTMHPLVVFLVLLESSWRGGVHGLGFMAFRLTMQNLWIFELFWILNNAKLC